MRKSVLISWDRSLFDGEKRLLPNNSKLYSQLYDLPKEGDSWSLVFEFDETPRIQGYISEARVYFLVPEAPHNILINGFRFDFMDGSTKVGTCEIKEATSIDFISEIQTRIDLIEDEKKELKAFANSIKIDNVQSNPDDIRNIFKYIDEYPYLFKLLVLLDKEIAFEYLDKYFFKVPLERNAVYHSNLSFFIYQLKSAIGEIRYLEFIDNLPLEVTSNELVKSALNDVD